jgi:hypothetical protein
MSIDPKKIALQVALRTTQMTGDDQAELESTYSTGLVASLDGKQIPLSALKDLVVTVEAEIAGVIANDKNHPFRAALYGRSANLASGALIPSTDNAVTPVEFIGIFSGVNDVSGDVPLLEADYTEVRRFLRKSADRYITTIKKFAFFNGRIYHTTATAYIAGCVFSRTAALARLTSTDLSPLPVQCEGMWIARCCQLAAQEGWFLGEGGYYAGIAEQGMMMLKNRELNLPTTPTNQASANPVNN